jgi:FtsP/CotA-like multicopper oxidase with cupredoxin domain
MPVDAAGEHELVMSVHREKTVFCYRYRVNGGVATGSPTIRLHRRDRFDLRIVNDIVSQSKGEYVASTAIPPCKPMAMPASATVHHYTGYLNHVVDDRYFSMKPADTNFHFHGFIGPAMEENIFLSTLSTPMHACEYHIAIPAAQSPGTYFYHPHAHGAAGAQVAGGLSGVWIVEPDTPQLPRSDEHVVVMRYHVPIAIDNAFQPDGTQIENDAILHDSKPSSAAPIVNYDPFDPPPWPKAFPVSGGGVTLDPTGCNGMAAEALIAVNSVSGPAELAVPAGETQLLRIVNATSDSAKLFTMRDEGGRIVPLHIAERDGIPVNGNPSKPLSGYVAANNALIAPFGRADVLVTVAPGQTLTLSGDHFCGGQDGFFQLHHELVRMTATAARPATPFVVDARPVPSGESPAAKMVAFVRAHPAEVRRRAITFTEYAFGATGDAPDRSPYYITDTTDRNFHEHAYWPRYAKNAVVPANPDIVVKRGTIEEWYLINATMEMHAFHIHQMSFIEERSQLGVPLSEDTVAVPVGTLLPNPKNAQYPLIRPAIVKVIMDFRKVPLGTFVFHCHMLFHEDNGMMATIRVV